MRWKYLSSSFFDVIIGATSHKILTESRMLVIGLVSTCTVRNTILGVNYSRFRRTASYCAKLQSLLPRSPERDFGIIWIYNNIAFAGGGEGRFGCDVRRVGKCRHFNVRPLGSGRDRHLHPQAYLTPTASVFNQG